jgi:CRP/FNR family transcriptional regulator
MPLDKRRKFSADPVGPVTVCRFSRDELNRFILSSPNMMRRIIEFAVRELELAQDQLLLLGNGSAEERVAIFLVSWNKRLRAVTACPAALPLPMRRQDIADFLGLKLETVSRTLAKLEHKNLIRLVPKAVWLTGLEQSPLVTGRSCEHPIELKA